MAGFTSFFLGAANAVNARYATAADEEAERAKVDYVENWKIKQKEIDAAAKKTAEDEAYSRDTQRDSAVYSMLNGGNAAEMNPQAAPAMDTAPYTATTAGATSVNNPGNMRPVGATTGFQQFATPEEGKNAMINDLNIKVDGRSKAMAGKDPTLFNIIRTWAPAADKNDPVAYTNFVSKRIGLKPDDIVTPDKVPELADAMATFEGNSTGASTPTTLTPKMDWTPYVAGAKKALGATSDNHKVSSSDIVGYAKYLKQQDDEAKKAANAKLGLDENGNVPRADDETLKLYGVPPAPNNAKLFGARGDTIKLKLQTDAVKAKDAAEKIEQNAVVAIRILESGTPTGGIANLLGAVRQQTDTNYQTLKAINKDMTLESFKSGSGLRTQQEFKTIQDANINPNLTKEAAIAILNKTVAFAKMSAERPDFISNYAQAHQTLDGSSHMYDVYAKANPIFSKANDAAPYQMSAGRKGYAEFFHPGVTAADSTAPDGTTVAAPTTSILSKFKAYAPTTGQ